jgi:hypothetical protein
MIWVGRDGRCLANKGFAIRQGETEGAELVFVGSVGGLGAAVHGGVPLEALAKNGALCVEGNRALARHFTTLFPLPEKLTV